MISEEKVKKLFEEYVENDEQYSIYIYTVVTARFSKIMLAGNLASLAHSYYILKLSDKKIDFILLNAVCKPVKHAYMLISDIENIKVSSWFFGIGKKYKIVLKDSSKLTLKANKFVIGMKNQKVNLDLIEKEYRKINLII